MTARPGDELARAKQPSTILAGTYGHPFHPLIVTVPIGAWVASLVFDLASRWAGDAVLFATASYWLIALGILGALAAALFGFLDLVNIPGRTRASRIAYTHMALNLAVTGLYLVGFLLREPDGAVPWGLIGLSLLALVLLAVSGWLGGTLAYRYGIRVADEQTQRTGLTTRED